jgi:hypothetical protein
VADLARTQIQKYGLIEKLGQIAGRANGYADVEVDQQLRAIQLLLSYGYGPPKAELDRNEGGVIIQVVYAERSQIAIAGTARGAIEGDSASETIQCSLLRAPLGQDGAGDGPTDPSGLTG